MAKPFYVLGLDLGQARDSTALAVIQVQGEPYTVEDDETDVQAYIARRIFSDRQDPSPFFDGPPAQLTLGHLERFPLGTRYPVIVEEVAERLARTRKLADGSDAILSVDATGVGRAVVDSFVVAGLDPIAVTITGGDVVTIDGRDVHVPKRDLIHCLLMAFQQQRFRGSSQLAEYQAVVKELSNFQMKVNLQTGHDSYEAWRASDHDDLVLAMAIATWVAEHELQARASAHLQAIENAQIERAYAATHRGY